MNGLGGIIILVIVIGGWVVKAINAANENKQSKGNRSNKPSVDYEALAERRRQELQQQAQQRRAQQGQQRQPTQVQQRDPATMSMAERIEMARQRDAQRRGRHVEVDQQAEALRDAQQQAQAEARGQAERARQEQVAQQRRAQQRQQQQRARQQNQPPQRATKPAAAAPPRRRRDLSTVAQDAQRKHKASHDRVLSKKAAGDAQTREQAANLGRPKRRKALLDFCKLNRRSLRQAIVLKEILDPPVALRDTPRH